jgi:hypothetical protein
LITWIGVPGGDAFITFLPRAVRRREDFGGRAGAARTGLVAAAEPRLDGVIK